MVSIPNCWKGRPSGLRGFTCQPAVLFVGLVRGRRPDDTFMPTVIQLDEFVMSLDAFVRTARIEYLRFCVNHLFSPWTSNFRATASTCGAAGTDLLCAVIGAQSL